MKKILHIIIIFFVITAIAAILDTGWIQETTKDAESIAGWILGGLFGSVILYYFIRGAVIAWPVLKVRFNITRAEEIGLVITWLILMGYFFFDGFIDSSAGFGAAVLLSSVILFGLFWVWRRLANIYTRIIHGDEAFQMPNVEYFSILAISLATAMYLTSLEPGMYTREYMNFAVIVIFLLFIVASVCFYWIYFVVKSLIRAKKFKGKDFEYTETELVCNASLRTVKIPWNTITSITQGETYAGLSGIPSRFGPARTTEFLIIESSGRKAPLAIPLPSKKQEAKIRDEAVRHGAVLKE